MLYLIQSHNRSIFNKTLNNMHKKRHEVFHVELGWDVPVTNGLEKDQYDIDSTIYMVSHDEEHGVVGGIRFLPTTGPNMIQDTFSNLIEDKSVIPNDPKIWESSRFFFKAPKSTEDYLGVARRGTIELFIGCIEFGISWGLNGILTLTDIRIEKMIKNAGLEFNRICPPIKVDGESVVIGVIPTTEEALRNIRERCEIDYPVLMSPLPVCPHHNGKVDLGIKSTRDLLVSSLQNQLESSSCPESTQELKS